MARSDRSQARTIAVALIATLVLALLGVIIFLGVRLVSAFTSDARVSNSNQVVVPDVKGVEATRAQATLRDAGLLPKDFQADYNDLVPKGQIYRQDPAPGIKVRRGRDIKLYTSLGPAQFIVPELNGQRLAEAPKLLAKSGFTLGQVTRIYDPDRAAGIIINQSPPAAQQLSSSTTVDVTVTDNEQLPALSMPDLAGMPLAEAETMLAADQYNLHLSRVTYVLSAGSLPGTVVEQTPPAGKEVRLGARVEAKVAIPPELHNQSAKSFSFSLQVPPGPQRQQVKIKVFDKLAPKGKVEYDKEHSLGDLIELSISVEGAAKIACYVGSAKAPYREDIIEEPLAPEPAPGGLQ